MNSLPKTILLATDGSEDAVLAAHAAVDLCQRSGADLHVVHAWQSIPSARYESFINSSLEEMAQENLDEQTEMIKTSGGEITGAHLIKEPSAEAIVDLASEIDADLIVMGSRGKGLAKRILLGSVSEGVVHHAHVPVLLLRGGEAAWPPVRVVVGEDTSEDARRAAELAIRLSGLYEAEVLLAHVVSVQWMVVKARAQGINMVDDLMLQAQEHLDVQAKELEGVTGVLPHTRAVMGYASLALSQIAEENQQTLTVVGSRGLNAVKRAMLGSVSSNVIRSVESPVLVVPPPVGERDASSN